MTQGGPAGSTTALSYYIYNKMFQDLDMGYAAAISWVLFAFIFLVCFVLIAGLVMYLSQTIDHGEARFDKDGNVIPNKEKQDNE